MKEELYYKVSITEIHQKVHILKVLSKTIKLTRTLDFTTKVHDMAIQPYNGDSNAALQ